jgi:hypothetical protein
MKTKIKLLFILLASLPVVVNASINDLSPARKQAIDSLALEKVRDLSKYIAIVGNKNTPWAEANRVIERTLELFTEGSQMGVSSLYRPEIVYYGIREYLERLMALNYDKVKIEWYDIHYISDLERQPDGRYVGVITIYQRFEGIVGEQMVYRDTTKKDITVYVERKQTQIGGRLIDFWDVFLGDIRVTETTP